MTTYNINQIYPISERENIELWWKSNRNFNINVNEEQGTVIITSRTEAQIQTRRIEELYSSLQSTDYVAAKLSEASAIAELTGDKTLLAEVYSKYAQTITDRRAWREELDSLLK